MEWYWRTTAALARVVHESVVRIPPLGGVHRVVEADQTVPGHGLTAGGEQRTVSEDGQVVLPTAVGHRGRRPRLQRAGPSVDDRG